MGFGGAQGLFLALAHPRPRVGISARVTEGGEPDLLPCLRPEATAFGISSALGKAALWGGASISRWCGEGCSRHMDSFASCLQLPL